MAAKMKKKLKFVSEDKFEEYSNMSEQELVDALKVQHCYLEDKEDSKKGSDLLKELRGEIKEYRAKWEAEYPEAVQELENLKEQIKVINADRDSKIESDLQEKKDVESSFRDEINGAKEHINALVFCLRFHQ